MINQKGLSLLMVALLVHQTIHGQSAYGMQGSEKEEIRAAKIKRQAEDLGIGAEIRAYVRDRNERQRGRIEGITDETLRLGKKGQMVELRFNNLTHLELVNSSYKAKGEIVPVQVRRVAVDIGVGGKTTIKLRSQKETTGKIQSIERERFTILASKTDTPVSVPFNEVTEISQKGLSFGAKVGLILAAIAGAMLIIGGLYGVKS